MNQRLNQRTFSGGQTWQLFFSSSNLTHLNVCVVVRNYICIKRKWMQKSIWHSSPESATYLMCTIGCLYWRNVIAYKNKIKNVLETRSFESIMFAWALFIFVFDVYFTFSVRQHLMSNLVSEISFWNLLSAILASHTVQRWASKEGRRHVKIHLFGEKWDRLLDRVYALLLVCSCVEGVLLSHFLLSYFFFTSIFFVCYIRFYIQRRAHTDRWHSGKAK